MQSMQRSLDHLKFFHLKRLKFRSLSCICDSFLSYNQWIVKHESISMHHFFLGLELCPNIFISDPFESTIFLNQLSFQFSQKNCITFRIYPEESKLRSFVLVSAFCNVAFDVVSCRPIEWINLFSSNTAKNCKIHHSLFHNVKCF